MTKERLSKLRALIGLFVFSLIISFLSPRFLTIPNMLNILKQTSINSIIAAGMTFVILTGGIDLSVGSILAFSGVICASLIAGGTNVFLSILISLTVGVLVGLLNGLIISKGKVQPFIATLATMTLLRGATLVFSDGRPITLGNSKSAQIFSQIGSGSFLNIPIPVYFMIFVFIISYYILSQTRLGRYIYAIGGNEEASRLSGLDTSKIKMSVYLLSGVLSALAGIIITSRLLSAQPNAGTGYELDAIAAVVLGGTSLAGGAGSILSTIVGSLIIGILNNALNLLNVSSYFQMIAKGMVILLAVLIDQKGKKGK